LKNGTAVDGVIIAWDKLVVFVEGGQIRMDARNVVSVASTPKKFRKMKFP